MNYFFDRRSLFSAVLLALLFLLLAHGTARASDFSIAVAAPADQWAPTMFAPGSTASFSVATDPAPVGAYQWFFNDAPIPGATTATLALTNLSAAHTGNYRLRCTPATGSLLWSQTLTVNVIATPPSRVNFTAQDPVNPAPAFPASAGRLLAVLPDGGAITSQAPWRVDASGNPAPLSAPATIDLTNDFIAVVQSDGKFLLAQGPTLLRFTVAGTPDPTFNYSSSIAYKISAVDVDLRDRLIVHRRTDHDVNLIYQTSIVRLLSSGAADASFIEEIQQQRVSAYNMNVGSFIPLASGYLVINQTFSYFNLHFVSDSGIHDPRRAITYSAEFPFAVDPSGRVFRVSGHTIIAYNLTDSALTLDSAYRVHLVGGNGGNNVRLSRLSDGELLVAGDFTSVDGFPIKEPVRLSSSDAPLTPIPTLTATYSNGSSDHLRAGFPCELMSTGTGGSLDYTFQWLALDGQPLPANTTSDTLTFPSFTRAQLGRYQLRVTGPYSSTLSPVIELTDMEETYPRLTNLSGRARVGTGENAAIAGLVLAPESRQGLLIRGAGPALEPFGIADFLPDPTLSISIDGGSIENDNWQDVADPYVTDFASRAGAFAFAAGSHDAARAGYLAAGPHTAILRDRADRSGIGLVEIYSDPNESTSALLNLSFRARTAPGDDTVIAGFVIDDPQQLGRSLRLLLRAVGPTLADHGITAPLADPMLTVYNSAGEVVAQNDDWSLSLAVNPTAADIAAAGKKVGAFDLLANSHDAALLLTLPAGAYTLHATAADGQPAGGSAKEGIVLLEIYLVP